MGRQMDYYLRPMLDALTRLCAIPSTRGKSAPDAPYGEQTARALHEFLQIGSELGFTCHNLDNRAGYVEFGSGEKLVAALCHLDVVPAGSGWRTDPWQLTIEDEKITARGTIDDKGPAVAVLFAMKALLDEGFRPEGRIRLIVGLDEESGSSCMAYYREKAELPSAGFTPDAEFPVIYAEKGIAWLQITMPVEQASRSETLLSAQGGNRPNMVPDTCTLRFTDNERDFEREYTGISAHASKPWGGRNAISLAMAAVGSGSNSFAAFFNRYIGETWDGRLLGLDCADESGPLTINAGQLQMTGDSARLVCDMRYPVSADFSGILARLRRITEPLGGKVEVIEHQQPLYTPRDSRLVSDLMECYREITGDDTEPRAIGGGTYARTMPNLVAFGPSFPGDPEMAHKAGEYISTATLLKSAEIYRAALRRLSR